MKLLCFISIGLFLSHVWSKSTEITPSLSESECLNDISEICFIEKPTTVEDIYYSRLCLWKNKDIISSNCYDYLTVESPSIVEPCLSEIESFCSGVNPGYGQVHNCLSSRSQDVTVKCANALVEDNMRVSKDGTVEESPGLVSMTFFSDASTHSTSQILQFYHDIVYTMFKPFCGDRTSSSSSSSGNGDNIDGLTTGAHTIDVYIVDSDDTSNKMMVVEGMVGMDKNTEEEKEEEDGYNGILLADEETVASDDDDHSKAENSLLFPGDKYSSVEAIHSPKSDSFGTTLFSVAYVAPISNFLSKHLAYNFYDTSDYGKMAAVSIEDLDKVVADTHSSIEFDAENEEKEQEKDQSAVIESPLVNKKLFLRQVASSKENKVNNNNNHQEVEKSQTHVLPKILNTMNGQVSNVVHYLRTMIKT